MYLVDNFGSYLTANNGDWLTNGSIGPVSPRTAGDALNVAVADLSDKIIALNAAIQAEIQQLKDAAAPAGKSA